MYSNKLTSLMGKRILILALSNRYDNVNNYVIGSKYIAILGTISKDFIQESIKLNFHI